jgi:hypothetical protein
METLEDRQSRRVLAVEARVLCLEETVRTQGEALDSIRTSLAQCRKTVGDMESAVTPTYVENLDFDRELNYTILRLNTAVHVSRVDVGEVVEGLCQEAGFPTDQAEIISDASDKNFVLQLLGDPALAAKRVNKLQGLLRPASRGGQWRELRVPAPDGSQTTLYIGMDKNPRMVQLERHQKLLAKLLRERFKLQVEVNKRESTLTTNFVPLARLQAPRRGETTIQWNLVAVGEAGLDRAAVVEAFKSLCASASSSASSTNWQ